MVDLLGGAQQVATQAVTDLPGDTDQRMRDQDLLGTKNGDTGFTNAQALGVLQAVELIAKEAETNPLDAAVAAQELQRNGALQGLQNYLQQQTTIVQANTQRRNELDRQFMAEWIRQEQALNMASMGPVEALSSMAALKVSIGEIIGIVNTFAPGMLPPSIVMMGQKLKDDGMAFDIDDHKDNVYRVERTPDNDESISLAKLVNPETDTLEAAATFANSSKIVFSENMTLLDIAKAVAFPQAATTTAPAATSGSAPATVGPDAVFAN